MDIRFYDLDFNLLRILPQYSRECGYSSCVVDVQLNGQGSFEVVFNDDILVRMFKSITEPMLTLWNGIWGYIPSFSFKDNEKRIIGTTLNGIAKRVVVQPCEYSQKTVGYIARDIVKDAIRNGAKWLQLGNEMGIDTIIDYKLETPKTMDEVLIDLIGYSDGGWRMYAENKKIVFECIKSEMISLEISENNLNAYDVEMTRNLNDVANIGYYKDESDDTWKSVGSALSGIHNSAAVLTSTTARAARKELALLTGKNNITPSVKSLQYGTDYNIGNIVRVRDNEIDVLKQVTEVTMAQESAYTETPTLSEVK